MVIDLGGTLYHYCDYREADVEVLALAVDSHAHYQSSIRGTNDCRTEGVVPAYSQSSVLTGTWEAWSEAVHMELLRDFDLDPQFRDGQISLITETLI